MAYTQHICFSCRVWNCMCILQLLDFTDVPLHNMHAVIHLFPVIIFTLVSTGQTNLHSAGESHHSPTSDLYPLVFPVTLPQFVSSHAFIGFRIFALGFWTPGLDLCGVIRLTSYLSPPASCLLGILPCVTWLCVSTSKTTFFNINYSKFNYMIFKKTQTLFQKASS